MTEHELMTMKSGVSPTAARRMPASAKMRATVEVSAKLSLQPKVWNKAEELSKTLLSVTISKFQKLVINISQFEAYDILDCFERFSRFHSVV